MEQGNPIAEARRQRKLENQRLEEEARRTLEEQQQRKEREREQLENERRAEEQRLAQELEDRLRKERAEADRVAAVEAQERQGILAIEKKLKLVGALCTDSVRLPACSSEAYPTCMAVMPRGVVEAAIGSTTASEVVFVADSTAAVHVFVRKAAAFVVSASLRYSNPQTTGIPVAMDRPGVLAVPVRELLQSYQPASVAFGSIHKPKRVEVTPVWIPLAAPGISMQGLALDDTSGELFVCDQANHQVVVLSLAGVTGITGDAGNAGIHKATRSDHSICIDRTFGRRGKGAGEVKRPLAVGVSHYHVAVCDSGNSRIVMFTKRGGFVRSIGCRGRGTCEFMDIRDVVLANVRKRAISRGIVADDNSISNEQFDIIVADLGNFRVQILDENGNFSRQLSLLADMEQVVFQQDQLGVLSGELLKEYASLKVEATALVGDDMKPLYALSRVLHPSDPAYARITTASYQWRFRRSRYHHPFAVSFAPSEREVVTLDRDNGCVHVYNMDGSRCSWCDILPGAEPSHPAMASMHSCLELELSSGGSVKTEGRRLFISDSLANRIAVVDATRLQVLSLIGASTYGDQRDCSPGYLPGELNHPTYLASFHDDALKSTILIVSDSGNHSISLFDARRGACVGRVGNGFGHEVGYFDSPQGVAVLKNRYLYVADQRNHRIQVFDLQGDRGKLLRAFGAFGSAPGQFNFPSAIAVCAALPSAPACDFGPHRGCKIAVADTGNCRVQVLDLEGSPLIVISMEQTPFSLPLMPLGVWIEQRSGYLLVCDGANQCVAMFRNDGAFLSSAGVALELENRFARPIGIIISNHSAGSTEGLPSSRLLIVDGERKQVCEFDLGPLAQ